jgi:DnaJ-class molecular chaperone
MKTNNDFKEVDQQASKYFAVKEWTETCQTCNGHGTIMRMKSADVGFVYTPETCSNCNGVGEIDYEKESKQRVWKK